MHSIFEEEQDRRGYDAQEAVPVEDDADPFAEEPEIESMLSEVEHEEFLVKGMNYDEFF